MDVDASDRRKIKIYAGKKKKKKEKTLKKFPQWLMPQTGMLWWRLSSREFLFANYAFVNNKYIQVGKVNLDESYLEAVIVLSCCCL